jgi:hypothetical protein
LNGYEGTVSVPSRRLPQLFSEHGVPFYCKIDVEGHDTACLSSLEGYSDLPPYISVESQCLGEDERSTEAQALETLHRLCALGYRRFKLVEQRSLAVLSSATIFQAKPRILARIRNRLGFHGYDHYNYSNFIDQHRAEVKIKYAYDFIFGSSGPFGEDLEGVWLDSREARKVLTCHHRDWSRLPGTKPYEFWCDWHATM